MDKSALAIVAAASTGNVLASGGNAAIIALVVQIIGLIASFLMGAKKKQD